MSQTLKISDDLFARLEAAAKQRGLQGIEPLLEEWQAQEDERHRRAKVVEEIDQFRARMFATYGEMPDSVPLIREDRER